MKKAFRMDVVGFQKTRQEEKEYSISSMNVKAGTG